MQPDPLGFQKSHLLLFEQVNATVATAVIEDAGTEETKTARKPAASTLAMKTHADQIATASPELLALFDSARQHILTQGEDIIEKPLKLYVAFRRIKNFVCMGLISKVDPHLFLTVRLNPETVDLEEGFTRDVRKIGHWGTGDLEIFIRDAKDLEKAKPLIERAYEEN
jgi:predicted transport protein